MESSSHGRVHLLHYERQHGALVCQIKICLCRYLEHYKILLAKKRYGGAPAGMPAASAVRASPARQLLAAVSPAEGEETAAAPAAKRARRGAATRVGKKRAIPPAQHVASPVAAQSKSAVLAADSNHAAERSPAEASSGACKGAAGMQTTPPKRKSPSPWAGMTAAALAQEQQRQQWQIAAMLPGDFAAPLVPALALPPAHALISSAPGPVAAAQFPLLAEVAPLSTLAPAGLQPSASVPPPLADAADQQPPALQTELLQHGARVGAAMHHGEAPSSKQHVTEGQQPEQQPLPSVLKHRKQQQQPSSDGLPVHDALHTNAERTSELGTLHGSDAAKDPPRPEEPEPAGQAAPQREQPREGQAAVKAVYANGHATTEYALERPRRDVRAPNRLPIGPVDAHKVRGALRTCRPRICSSASAATAYSADVMINGCLVTPLCTCGAHWHA